MKVVFQPRLVARSPAITCILSNKVTNYTEHQSLVGVLVPFRVSSGDNGTSLPLAVGNGTLLPSNPLIPGTLTSGEELIYGN